MADTDQAQADQNSPETVEDPLDASDTTNSGTSELTAYEAEIANLDVSKLPGDEESAEDADADGEQASEDNETDDEQADEESSEDDTQEGEQPNTSNRFRVRAKDALEAEALALRKRHPDWSLKNCIAKAESILGLDDTTEETGQQDAPARETVESVNAQIEELRRRRKEATAEMEFETTAELADQIDDLRDRRDALRVTESQDKAETDTRNQNAHDTKFLESKRRTVTFYPDAGKAGHPLINRILEMDAEMHEMGDPLYHDPDKPWILAKRAAVQLRIPMTKPNSASVRTNGSPKSPIQPAAGNRGTTSTGSTQRFEAEIGKLDSLEAYERLVGRA